MRNLIVYQTSDSFHPCFSPWQFLLGSMLLIALSDIASAAGPLYSIEVETTVRTADGVLTKGINADRILLEKGASVSYQIIGRDRNGKKLNNFEMGEQCGPDYKKDKKFKVAGGNSIPAGSYFHINTTRKAGGIGTTAYCKKNPKIRDVKLLAYNCGDNPTICNQYLKESTDRAFYRGKIHAPAKGSPSVNAPKLVTSAGGGSKSETPKPSGSGASAALLGVGIGLGTLALIGGAAAAADAANANRECSTRFCVRGAFGCSCAGTKFSSGSSCSGVTIVGVGSSCGGGRTCQFGVACTNGRCGSSSSCR